MRSSTSESRKNSRRTGRAGVIRLEVKDGLGQSRWSTADLTDVTERGVGITLMKPLKVGSTINIRGKLDAGQPDVQRRAKVCWCQEIREGHFRAGLELLDVNAESGPRPADAVAASGELDCYEVMQLSPNADHDTISRVYRMLAQRYHPDNPDTGNAEMFMQLTAAFEILNEPARRASFDARHRQTRQLHWNIFDQSHAAAGPEAERRKRQGILGVLYAKALHDPENAEMTIFDFEQLLGCPREHLGAALWYLKGKNFIRRSDNGRYAITVPGFEEAEARAKGPSPDAERKQIEPAHEYVPA
jgi:DnaJ domain